MSAVAVKVFNAGGSIRSDSKLSLEEETKIAFYCNSPFIIKTFGVCMVPPKVSIVCVIFEMYVF